MTIRFTRRSRRLAVTAGATAAFALASVAPALAGTPTGIFTDFKQCPRTNPAVASCLLSDTISGSFKLGNKSVPITQRIRVQGGYTVDFSTGKTTFFPAANGETLERVSLNVPGGLLGITPPNLVPWPFRDLAQLAIDTANDVTATPELVGPVKFDFVNFFTGSNGTVMQLPLRIKLSNPFLGGSCYIGGAGDPLTLNVTSGTTTGTPPMTGAQGTVTSEDPDGNLFLVSGLSFVDNTFRAPSAHNCGGIVSQLIITPIVNAMIGLPANPGVSTARMNGSARVATAAAVTASE